MQQLTEVNKEMLRQRGCARKNGRERGGGGWEGEGGRWSGREIG